MYVCRTLFSVTWRGIEHGFGNAYVCIVHIQMNKIARRFFEIPRVAAASPWKSWSKAIKRPITFQNLGVCGGPSLFRPVPPTLRACSGVYENTIIYFPAESSDMNWTFLNAPSPAGYSFRWIFSDHRSEIHVRSLLVKETVSNNRNGGLGIYGVDRIGNKIALVENKLRNLSRRSFGLPANILTVRWAYCNCNKIIWNVICNLYLLYNVWRN